MASENFSFKYRPVEAGSVGPIVASFLSGPPPEAALSGENSLQWKPLIFGYEKPPKDKRGNKRKLTASSDQMTFEASSHGDDVQKGVYRYAVGVVNTKHKCVDVYDAECGGILFGLRPTRSSEDEIAAVSSALEGASAKARRDMLIDAFGSRKKQKMERSKAANIVDISAITAAGSVAADLRDRATAVGRPASAAASDLSNVGTTERKVQEGLAASRRSLLPPFNLHAAIPDNVYPLDSLLGGETVLEGLSGPVNAVMKLLKDGAGLAQEIGNIARGNDYLRENLLAVTASPKGGAVAAGGEDGDGAGGGLKKAIVRRKLRCLLMLKYMFAMSGSGESLRYVVPKVKPAAGREGVQSVVSAETPAAPSDPIIPQLRFVPTPVLAYLLAKFSESRVESIERAGTDSGAVSASTSPLLGKTYVRTPELQSSLLAHIAVLALTVADFKLGDIGLLSAAVKLTPAKFLISFREAGCTYEPIRGIVLAGGRAAGEEEDMDGEAEAGARAPRAGIVSYSVRLNTPLTFPKPKAGPRRK